MLRLPFKIGKWLCRSSLTDRLETSDFSKSSCDQKVPSNKIASAWPNSARSCGSSCATAGAIKTHLAVADSRSDVEKTARAMIAPPVPGTGPFDFKRLDIPTHSLFRHGKEAPRKRRRSYPPNAAISIENLGDPQSLLHCFLNRLRSVD